MCWNRVLKRERRGGRERERERERGYAVRDVVNLNAGLCFQCFINEMSFICVATARTCRAAGTENT